MMASPRDLAEQAVLSTVSGPFAAPVLSLLERAQGADGTVLRVLTYHRIADAASTPELDPGIVSATPEQFARQVEFLARAYQVIGLETVLEAIRTGRPLPPRSVLITFDDAYEDFQTAAWPLLRAHRMPVTLFVPTAFPDAAERRFWWDHLHHALTQSAHEELQETPLGPLALSSTETRLEAATRLKACLKTLPHREAMDWYDRMVTKLECPRGRNPVLGWEALRHLAAEGVTLCPHTRTHPLLERVSEVEALAEVSGSLRDLEQAIGPTLPVLAYPAGSVCASLAERMRSAGFTLAFTTAHGVNDLRTADLLRLRRINVGQRTSLGVLRTRLLAGSTYLNRFRPLPS